MLTVYTNPNKVGQTVNVWPKFWQFWRCFVELFPLYAYCLVRLILGTILSKISQRNQHK